MLARQRTILCSTHFATRNVRSSCMCKKRAVEQVGGRDLNPGQSYPEGCRLVLLEGSGGQTWQICDRCLRN